MEGIKTVIVTVFSVVAAYCEPVRNAMFLLFLMAGIDLLAGMICSIAIDHERFRFKKFIMAVVYLLIYLGVIALIYTVGRFQGDYEGAMLIVKTITYVFIYFYSANILKNLTALFPANRVIGFLYYVIDLEFTKKIPYLGDFLKTATGEKSDKPK